MTVESGKIQGCSYAQLPPSRRSVQKAPGLPKEVSYDGKPQGGVSPRCRVSAWPAPWGHAHVAVAEAPIDLLRLLAAAMAAAEAGAKVVKRALDKPHDMHYKGSADLVSGTDKAAEIAVLEVLRSCFPDHGVLGEEGGVSGDPSSPYLWIVDPIDGTTNFVHSYPPFAVSVGVLHHSEPVAGCVIEFVGGKHAWATRTYTAHKGGGAFCQGQPIGVSKQSSLPHSLLVTGFVDIHDEARATNIGLFEELTKVAQGVRRSGASSVNLCHVALGIVEGYWEVRVKPWGVAAGAIIAKEAGAVLSTMDGKPYSVFEHTIIAAPAGVHAQLLQQTAPKMKAVLRQYGSGAYESPSLC